MNKNIKLGFVFLILLALTTYVYSFEGTSTSYNASFSINNIGAKETETNTNLFAGSSGIAGNYTGGGVGSFLFVTSSQTKGIIPVNDTAAKPFYTIDENPQNRSNTASLTLNKDDTVTLTWQINATGDVDTTWEFFADAVVDIITSITNQTPKILLNIDAAAPAGDTTAPTYTGNNSNTTSPPNATRVTIFADWTDETALNYTWSGNNFTGTWINETIVARAGLTNVNHTNITLVTAGGNKDVCYYLYANDTSGNLNQTTLSCFTIGNSAPTVPTLVSPADKSNITDRTPYFNWTDSTDPEDDTITYEILIDCPSCTLVNETNIADSNFTPSSNLDLDVDYNWKVRAYDGTDYSAYSSNFNFTVVSVSIILVNGTVSFGSLNLGVQDNTSDNNPGPFEIQNDGNVDTNVSIYASTALWERAALNTSNFQFKIDNTSETSAFNYITSLTVWTNITGTASTDAVQAIKEFNFTDTKDTAEVDILVDVPLDEPSGAKSSTIVFEAQQS